MNSLFKKGLAENTNPKMASFKPYRKSTGNAHEPIYTDNSKIYIHPTGYIYITTEVYKWLGSPMHVVLGGWPNGTFAIVPHPEDTQETYKVHVNNSAVRLSCIGFLRDAEMMVEGNIVSYPLILASAHPEIPGRFAHWNRNYAPTIERRFEYKERKKKG